MTNIEEGSQLYEALKSFMESLDSHISLVADSEINRSYNAGRIAQSRETLRENLVCLLESWDRHL